MNTPDYCGYSLLGGIPKRWFISVRYCTIRELLLLLILQQEIHLSEQELNEILMTHPGVANGMGSHNIQNANIPHGCTVLEGLA